VKKSEVREEIAEVIRLNAEVTMTESENCADLILEKIEKLGMLPPRIKLVLMGLEDNAWDPE
jgi:hypothetical protein